MATLNRLAAGVAWEKPADLSNKDVLRELTPSALRAFLKIRELWEKLADRWIQLPNDNPMFEGGTPLSYMLRGGLPGMLRVRQLVDSRRGGR